VSMATRQRWKRPHSSAEMDALKGLRELQKENSPPEKAVGRPGL
jgi:hypothetical protein